MLPGPRQNRCSYTGTVLRSKTTECNKMFYILRSGSSFVSLTFLSFRVERAGRAWSQAKRFLVKIFGKSKFRSAE